MDADVERLAARMPQLPKTQCELTWILRDSASRMTRLFKKELRPYDLTETEFRVLFTLFLDPREALNPSDLSAMADESFANVSRVSDSLFKRGLISRAFLERDRRRITLQVTDKGSEFMRRVLPAITLLVSSMFEQVSMHEQRVLLTQLKKMHLRSAET